MLQLSYILIPLLLLLSTLNYCMPSVLEERFLLLLSSSIKVFFLYLIEGVQLYNILCAEQMLC